MTDGARTSVQDVSSSSLENVFPGNEPDNNTLACQDKQQVNNKTVTSTTLHTDTDEQDLKAKEKVAFINEEQDRMRILPESDYKMPSDCKMVIMFMTDEDTLMIDAATVPEAN